MGQWYDLTVEQSQAGATTMCELCWLLSMCCMCDENEICTSHYVPRVRRGLFSVTGVECLSSRTFSMR